MLFKENWETGAKERLTALWEKEIIDRCTMAIPVVTNPQRWNMLYEKPKEPDGLIRQYSDPDSYHERMVARFECTSYLGESLPGAFPSYGVGGHVAYMGGNPVYTPTSVWFMPVIDDWEKDHTVYDPNNSLLKLQMNLMKRLSMLGRGQYFVTMPDNCGSMDGVAGLRGSENLLEDMYDNPEYVERALKKVLFALEQSSIELFEAAKESNEGGSSHSWMHLWSPGKLLQLQCDLSVMISPAMFEKFILPELEETTSWLDHSVYHFDGIEQLRHLDMILSVKNLDMIQWTRVAGQPPTSDNMEALKKIQKAGKGLVLFPELWEVEKFLDELSPNGLHLVVHGVTTDEDAMNILKMAERKAAGRGR